MAEEKILVVDDSPTFSAISLTVVGCVLRMVWRIVSWAIRTASLERRTVSDATRDMPYKTVGRPCSKYSPYQIGGPACNVFGWPAARGRYL